MLARQSRAEITVKKLEEQKRILKGMLEKLTKSQEKEQRSAVLTGRAKRISELEYKQIEGRRDQVYNMVPEKGWNTTDWVAFTEGKAPQSANGVLDLYSDPVDSDLDANEDVDEDPDTDYDVVSRAVAKDATFSCNLTEWSSHSKELEGMPSSMYPCNVSRESYVNSSDWISQYHQSSKSANGETDEYTDPIVTQEWCSGPDGVAVPCDVSPLEDNAKSNTKEKKQFSELQESGLDTSPELNSNSEVHLLESR